MRRGEDPRRLGFWCVPECVETAYREAGVTRLSINPVGPNRLETIEKVKGWIS